MDRENKLYSSLDMSYLTKRLLHDFVLHYHTCIVDRVKDGQYALRHHLQKGAKTAIAMVIMHGDVLASVRS